MAARGLVNLNCRPMLGAGVTGKSLVGVILVVMLAVSVLGPWMYRRLRSSFEQTEVLAEYGWTITGKVCDLASNALPGVTVEALATPRVTVRDRLSEHRPDEIRFSTTTDRFGDFKLVFSAAFFAIRFAKPNYIEQTITFGPYVEKPTNTAPVLDVNLGAEGTGR